MPTEPTPDSLPRAGTHPAAQRQPDHQTPYAQRPGSEYRSLIEAAVENVLTTSARGRDRAMTGEALAEAVAVVLASRGLELRVTPRTLKRRCQEAVAALVATGSRIGSWGGGYYLPETLEDIEAGERPLLAHLISTAKRLRVYRRGVADEILRLLGQERIGGVA